MVAFLVVCSGTPFSISRLNNTSSERPNPLEDWRVVGLGGWGVDGSERTCDPSRRCSEALMVDEDDDEVIDSLTAVRPLLCEGMISSAGNFLLVTGGRLLFGLICFLDGALIGVPTPGDCDDMDVDVEVLLKLPGDSERRVDDPLSWTNVGVGCGRFGVNEGCGGLRVLKLAMRELEVANLELGPMPEGAYRSGVVETAGTAIPSIDSAK